MEDQIINENMGLVKSIVSQFNPKNPTEFDDLKQAGMIGLMKAIRKFDSTRGNRFTTYAYYYVLGEIKDFIRQEQFSHLSQDRSCVPVSKPYTTVTEYLDNLSDIEQNIVNMRLEGYTFLEISNKLGYSATWIHQVYKQMIDRIILKNENE